MEIMCILPLLSIILFHIIYANIHILHTKVTVCIKTINMKINQKL